MVGDVGGATSAEFDEVYGGVGRNRRAIKTTV
jgi:hypothetical protein